MNLSHRFGLGMVRFFLWWSVDGQPTVSGIEHLSSHPRTIYISNHDDIVREGGLLNYLLDEEGLPIASLGMGGNLHDNLLFRLLRTLQPIHPSPRGKGEGKAIAEINEGVLARLRPIWTPQSGGRSKDGWHAVHPRLFPNHVAAAKIPLNLYLSTTAVQPFTVTTEYEPTARRLARAYIAGKRRGDDFANIFQGLWFWKGRAHLSFAAPIREAKTLDELTERVTEAIRAGHHPYWTHQEAYQERSRHAVTEWSTASVRLDLLSGRLRRQAEGVREEYRPALIARYALVVHEKRLAERSPRASRCCVARGGAE